MKVARQLPVKAIIVLLIIKDFWNAFYGKKPALKDGQNIHKKNVPIIAKVELKTVVYAFFITWTFFPNIKQTVKPKYAPNVWIAVLPPTSFTPNNI